MFKISSCKNFKNLKFQVPNFNPKSQVSKFQSFNFQSFKIQNFQIPIPSFQASKIKLFSKKKNRLQGTTKIKVFLMKMKSRRNKWKSHISKTVGPQSPHHLKTNPKSWLFAGNSQVKVEKPFDRYSSSRIKVEKPFDRHSSSQIKVKKPYGRHSSGSKVEKLLGYLSSRSRLKSPLVGTALVPWLKSPLVTFLQNWGWKAPRMA